MLSASPRLTRVAALGACGAIAVGGLSACETTQEKAAARQAEAARILQARAKRNRAHHHDKADGTKTTPGGSKSSPQRKGKG